MSTSENADDVSGYISQPKMESLQMTDVVRIFDHWNMKEYVAFIRDNRIDGRKILNLPGDALEKCPHSVERFTEFVEDMKRDPKYLTFIRNDVIIKETNLNLNSQYQTVSVRKISQESNFNTVEEILKKLTIPKSFLYRNQQRRTEKAVTSYVPMDKNTPKKKFFRFSNYDYPIVTKKTKDDDRGYYCIRTKESKTYSKTEMKPRYHSLPSKDEGKKIEDHLYEDLCYSDMLEKPESPKPRLVKIQELFQSFKFPFFKKPEVIEEKVEAVEKNMNMYENEIVDGSDAMYDSVHPATDIDVLGKGQEQANASVEEYLEPVQVSRDYCDVTLKRDESLLGFIMSYLETRFGRRETNEAAHAESKLEPPGEEEWGRKTNMAARPLPVPVENEPYFMNVDRREAEYLLLGQPDGAFILRPSSQTNHAYTLSVSCGNSVHNVGIRRRPDGRLALGFPRRGERSFNTIGALLQHHKKRRLLLVAGGDLIGATTLNDTPQYYQTPKSLPLTPRL